MSVRKLFWEDPYLANNQAKITGVQGNLVTVDQSVAFAFSGGQQSDIGTIGGYDILDAYKQGGQIFYQIQDDHDLRLDQDVEVVIDWTKRYQTMKLHFGAELVLELVYRNFGHPEKIGANITHEKARVDFFWDGNINEIFAKLQEMLDAMIAADLPITCGFEDEQRQKRFWKIAGFAKVPCGGTHIRSTGEIGALALKRKNIGKAKERIEIYLQ